MTFSFSGATMSSTHLSSSLKLETARSRSSVIDTFSSQKFVMRSSSITLCKSLISFFTLGGMTCHIDNSSNTALWSEINGPGSHLFTCKLDFTSMKTKSRVLPFWCVSNVTFWSKPIASRVSMKTVASPSVGSLMCILKSPMIIVSVYFAKKSMRKIVISSIKALTPLPFESGGW